MYILNETEVAVVSFSLLWWKWVSWSHMEHFHAHINRPCNNAVLCSSRSKMLIKALSSDTCVCHIAMGNAEDFKAPLTRSIEKGLLKCFCALRDMGINCLLTVIMIFYKSLLLPALSSRWKAMRRQGRNWDRGGEVTWMFECFNLSHLQALSHLKLWALLHYICSMCTALQLSEQP